MKKGQRQRESMKALPAVGAPGVQHGVALVQVMLKPRLQALVHLVSTSPDLGVLPGQALAVVRVHCKQRDTAL